MVITNEDIKVLEDIKKMIYGDKGNIETIEKYVNLIDNLKKQKKEHANKQNQWNKDNREYHRIANNISNNKVSGNKEKEEYWRNKLKEYKEKRGR